MKSFAITDLDKRVKNIGKITKESLNILNERLEKLEEKKKGVLKKKY
jgi:hypothetical protein